MSGPRSAPAPNTYNAAWFPGSDASICINACIAAVIQAGGGVCDAGSLNGNQAMSQEIELGSPATAGKVGVTLLLPEAATWAWSLTGGTSCGIRQYSGTAMLGTQPGGAGNRMMLTASPGAAMDSIYCTDGEASGVNYVRAEGFAIANNSASSSFASGLVHVRNVGAQARFSRIYAQNDYGDAWHLSSVCCGAQFDSIEGASNTAGQGGIPLTIGPGDVRSISIRDSAFNTPGSGHPNVLILGQTPVLGVNFYNLHMLGNGMADSTTAMVYIGSQVGPVHFFGGVANTLQSSLASTKTVFENHGFKLNVSGFDTVGTTVGINDVTAGIRVPVRVLTGSLGNIPPYTTLPAANKQEAAGFQHSVSPVL